LFSIVAVPFDAFASLPSPQDRWLLTCFSRYVDKAGKAFPSLRQLAIDARMSLATVCRRMAGMAGLGVFQRERQPGGRYRYTLAAAYRPRWPGKAKPQQNQCVSAGKQGVSQAATQEANPTKQTRQDARARVSFGEMSDERGKWQARLRGWRQSRFWLPLWGAKPGEAGCMVPAALLGAAAY
jgi:hypothetical protein